MQQISVVLTVHIGVVSLRRPLTSFTQTNQKKKGLQHVKRTHQKRPTTQKPAAERGTQGSKEEHPRLSALQAVVLVSPLHKHQTRLNPVLERYGMLARRVKKHLKDVLYDFRNDSRNVQACMIHDGSAHSRLTAEQMYLETCLFPNRVLSRRSLQTCMTNPSFNINTVLGWINEFEEGIDVIYLVTEFNPAFFARLFGFHAPPRLYFTDTAHAHIYYVHEQGAEKVFWNGFGLDPHQS